MDLNSSSDEEEAPVAAPPPPPPPPPQVLIDPTGGATTESMDVDQGNEEVLEVEVEAVWEAEDDDDEEEEELNPHTLGVPGLKTLVPGDHVEVLWANGACSPLFLPPTPQAPRELQRALQAGKGGESRSACSRCRQAGPSSSTASRTMMARRLPPALTHSMGPERSHSRATVARRNRWQRTCARSRHGGFVRWRPRRKYNASSSAGAC